MTEPPDQPDDSPDPEQLRRFLASHQLDDEQLRRIEEQLDEAEEASRRMGRRDWLLLFVGTLLTLVIISLVHAAPRSLPYEILVGALAITAVIATAIAIVRSRRPSELPDPDEPLRQRVKYVSEALTSSVMNLDLATRLMSDLQTELSSREAALVSLRQDITDNEELARVTAEASAALDRLVESRLKEQERRIRRVGWRQGLVYALFGAAVAVAVVVFSHYLPTIK